MSTAVVERVGSKSAIVTFAELSQPFQKVYGTFDNACRDVLLNGFEEVKVNDKLHRSVNTTLREKIRTIERAGKSTLKPNEEYFSIVDAKEGFLYTRNSKETFRVGESCYNTSVFERFFEQSVGIKEFYANKTQKAPFEEKLFFTDLKSNPRFMDSDKTFGESIGVCFVNDIVLNVKKVSKENIKTNDYVAQYAIHVIDETLPLKDILDSKTIYNCAYVEDIALSELFENNYKLNVSETQRIIENNMCRFTKPFSLSVGVSEDWNKKSWHRRGFKEQAGFVDEEYSKVIKVLNEKNLALFDSFIKNSNGIMSNLYIKEGGMSLNEFLERTDVVSGYTRFTEFKVGEYEYKNALFRISMNASDQAKPTAQEITLHVDIPDTDDRGTAVITGETEISFNKFFYTVPEVQVTLRAASSADGVVIPSITNITKGYFRVRLMNNKGELVNGSISWVAKGY